VQPLLFRRSPLPDADMDRLRAVGSVLSHAGVPMRYSLWKAVVATIVATAIGAFGILRDFADIAPPESRRVAGTEREQRFVLTRQVNVRASASSASAAVGQLSAGTEASGTIIINPSGQPWLRLSEGPLAGRYVWGRNLTELGALQPGGTATEPILNGSTALPAPPPPPLPVTSEWLTGGWVAQDGYCGVEGGERFNPGGRYVAYPWSGTWRLEGTRLTVVASHSIDEGRGIRIDVRRAERVAQDELIFHPSIGPSVRARRCGEIGTEPW